MDERLLNMREFPDAASLGSFYRGSEEAHEAPIP